MGAWGWLPVEGSGGNRHNRLSRDAATFQNDRTFPLPDHKTNYPTKPLAGCSSVSDQQTIEMEGKRDDIRKGPWKAEEDQVLINHVNKYGPRDWSSIRSKGLLRRTGKSCRLRWVNKLRPNLKSGCKFTPEEERVVIELQAEFGNKWARIATYLQGRTDNDVKNFWSSRQKRLARILHNNSSSSSHPKSHRSRREALVSRQLPALEAPNFSSSWDEDSASKAQSCSSSTSYKAESSLLPLDSNTIQMVQFPDLVSQGLLDFNANTTQPEPLSAVRTQGSEVLLEMPHTELKFSSDSQVLGRFEDPYFPQLFGTVDVPELASADVGQPFFDTVRRDEPDVFFDDFPADMFDHMEALPSP